MLKTDRIYVAGHCGMVGSACVRALKGAGYGNVVVRTHAELDLLDPAAVRAFYAAERPPLKKAQRDRRLPLTCHK